MFSLIAMFILGFLFGDYCAIQRAKAAIYKIIAEKANSGQGG